MGPTTSRSKIRSYFHLFAPSPAGLLFTGFAALLIIGLHQVASIQHYLGIPGDIDFTRIFMLWLDQTLTRILGESRTNAFVIGTFWALVGLAVYIFLQALARFIYEIGEGVEERHFVWPKGAKRLEPVKRATELAVFRLVAFCTLVYVLLQPLAQLMDHVPFEHFLGPTRALQFIVWLGGLLLIMHICIILMRLVAIRPRLFQ